MLPSWPDCVPAAALDVPSSTQLLGFTLLTPTTLYVTVSLAPIVAANAVQFGSEARLKLRFELPLNVLIVLPRSKVNDVWLVLSVTSRIREPSPVTPSLIVVFANALPAARRAATLSSTVDFIRFIKAPENCLSEGAESNRACRCRSRSAV